MDSNKQLDALLKMRTELKRDYSIEGIRYQVLSDALEHEELNETTGSTGEAVGYLKDVCTHGCQSGVARGMVYYADTKSFFMKHLDEIDEMRSEMEDSLGEPLRIGTPLYNWLAWFAYEETARAILQDISVEV